MNKVKDSNQNIAKAVLKIRQDNKLSQEQFAEMVGVSIAWILILMSAILILKAAPVESINRELDNTEKEHCQKVTMKILMGVIA